MKVQVIKPGYHGGKRYKPGDVFDVADGLKGSWFAPVESATVAKPKGRGKAPETFSDMAKADAATVAPEGGGGDLV